ncbi:MAG: hypothetical protein SCK28_01250 [Bacillota bacterium]|nr:hypothetical protein [Bacillota bacterium]
MDEKKIISRKSFIKGAGTSLAGLALVGGLSTLLSGCTLEEEALAETTKISLPEVPKWPFAYKKLDPDIAAQRGYDGYKKDG